MEFYTTVEAIYFTLLLNLENKAALKTASEFFCKNIGVKNVYNCIYMLLKIL